MRVNLRLKLFPSPKPADSKPCTDLPFQAPPLSAPAHILGANLSPVLSLHLEK